LQKPITQGYKEEAMAQLTWETVRDIRGSIASSAALAASNGLPLEQVTAIKQYGGGLSNAVIVQRASLVQQGDAMRTIWYIMINGKRPKEH